jgi:hypothetical protein
MKRPTRVALAAAGILTLAACSSAEPEAATPDESGLIPITVGWGRLRSRRCRR